MSLEGYQLSNYDAIVKYFTKNTRIKILNLADTQIAYKPLKMLVVEITRQNLPITSLKLNKNKTVDDKVASLLCILFYAKSSLKQLYLDQTNVTYEGFMEILKATAQNIKVNKLSFIDCPLLKIETSDEMQQVQECL